MRDVTRIIAVLGANGIPLPDRAVYVDGPLPKRALNCACTLVLAQIDDGLIQVVVAKAALHGLKVAGIFGIELINEIGGVFGIGIV